MRNATQALTGVTPGKPRRRGLLLLGAIATLSLVGAPAWAQAINYTYSYTSTSAYPIADAVRFDVYAGSGPFPASADLQGVSTGSSPYIGSGITNGYLPAGTNTLSYTQTEPEAGIYPPVGAFFLGVATNLASDLGDGQQHLVVFANTNWTSGAQDIAFGTLFPNLNEATLISDLEGYYSGDNGGADSADLERDADQFLNEPSGSSPNGPITITAGDQGGITAFSNGQLIGTVTSQPISSGSVSAAPEPSTWALMLAGIAGVGCASRKAKRRHGFTLARALAG